MSRIPETKWIYWLIALLALGLGLIGVVLPLLPTTPFLILALWAAGKCSPKLAHWLENHPRFGVVIKNWRDHRAIPITAKWLACGMMLLSFGIVWFRGASSTMLLIMMIIIVMMMAYILSKPSR